jgi:hypothetical protein
MNSQAYIDELLVELRLLRARNKVLERACSQMQGEIQQTAGKALGYPWFKDDAKNFPDALEEDGVCVGEHIAETIVAELASKYAALLQVLDELHELGFLRVGDEGGVERVRSRELVYKSFNFPALAAWVKSKEVEPLNGPLPTYGVRREEENV